MDTFSRSEGWPLLPGMRDGHCYQVWGMATVIRSEGWPLLPGLRDYHFSRSLIDRLLSFSMLHGLDFIIKWGFSRFHIPVLVLDVASLLSDLHQWLCAMILGVGLFPGSQGPLGLVFSWASYLSAFSLVPEPSQPATLHEDSDLGNTQLGSKLLLDWL